MYKMAKDIEIGEYIETETFGECEVIGTTVGTNLVGLYVEDFGNGYRVTLDFEPEEMVKLVD